MAVTPDDVAHVAQLARLDIQVAELAGVTAQFQSVLDLVATLDSVPTDGVEPMSNPHDMTQRLRPDTVEIGASREQLQHGAPATEAGYFLVPRVIDG